MRQAKVVIRLEQGHLLAQARFTLTQGRTISSDKIARFSFLTKRVQSGEERKLFCELLRYDREPMP